LIENQPFFSIQKAKEIDEIMRNTVGDRILLIVIYIAIAAFAIFCILPLVILISGSLTDEAALVKDGYSIFPGKFSLMAYQTVFASKTIFRAYGITIFTTVVGTVLSLLFTSSLAYAISGKTLKYRNRIAFYVYFTMLFNGGLVSYYVLISKYLHMSNNIWVYIIPSLINPWNMFLMRNFFNTIPESIFESLKIDGAQEFTILFKAVLPLSKPALATIGLFYALAYWNEWFRAILFIGDEKLYSLQYIIMKILRSLTFSANLTIESGMSGMGGYLPPALTTRMATTFVTIGPIIFLYPFLQKYFVKGGLTIGAIKG
jgi:multiple sugar transport system permease protein/putative aldouronate transport system permease protein